MDTSLPSIRGRSRAVDGSLGFSQMPLADGEAIEGLHFMAALVTRRFRPEIVFEILPVIAALEVGAERAAGVVPAMHHAILAARIAGDAVDDAVFVPVHLLQHLLVTGVMAVGHEVTGRFPAANVAGRNRQAVQVNSRLPARNS